MGVKGNEFTTGVKGIFQILFALASSRSKKPDCN